jgi:hypothetical protein
MIQIILNRATSGQMQPKCFQRVTSAQFSQLAANLTQIKTLTQAGVEEQAAQDLIRESQIFIEWVVHNLDLETNLVLSTELVELQRQLSRWKLHWSVLWSNPQERSQIAQCVQEWSDRLHNLSKLLVY